MNVEQFLYTLPYMGLGMVGIFSVTLLIIASIVVLNKLTSRKKKDETPPQ